MRWNQLTSSVGDSPARTLVSPDREPASVEPGADSGRSTPDSSTKSVPPMSLPKMFRHFDLADWTQCYETSRRSGMMRNGIVYPLPTLVPLTGVTASGSLPILSAPAVGGRSSRDATGRSASRKMWLTPRAVEFDYRSTEAVEKRKEYREAVGVEHGSLTEQVRWLSVDETTGATDTGGMLNPLWVEWLMGFPPTWTELDASAMRLYHKLRSKSFVR